MSAATRKWLVGALALALAGCGTDAGTGRPLLQRTFSQAFVRAYEAERRMVSGRGEVDAHPGVFDPDDLVLRARTRCRRRGPAPPADQPQRLWTCRVSYRDRYGRSGAPVYRVAVDEIGCFTATSRDFPPRVPERILRRLANNPLAAIRSCP